MRTFWAVLILLVAATIAVFVFTGGNKDGASLRSVSETQPEARPLPEARPESSPRLGTEPTDTVLPDTKQPDNADTTANADVTAGTTEAGMTTEAGPAGLERSLEGTEPMPGSPSKAGDADPRAAVEPPVERAAQSGETSRPGTNMPRDSADPRSGTGPGSPVGQPDSAPPVQAGGVPPPAGGGFAGAETEPATVRAEEAGPVGANPQTAVPESAGSALEPLASVLEGAKTVMAKMASYAPDPSKPLPVATTSPGGADRSLEKPKETEEPAEQAVVKTDEGLLLDGRWKVPGKGTRTQPYSIDWDMLVAVQQDYKPRLGQTEIPEWIGALDGKTVTIRGYALLPTGMSSTSELLVMLNQWDSCCIGVPPTPFDAIEVRLAEDLGPSARSMFSHTGALSFGDITGTFKVDPYIVQGWLLGLYLMEDAKAELHGPAGTP